MTERRIIVIGSRFTTVLQYQARDLIMAFKRLGHDALMLTEGPEADKPMSFNDMKPRIAGLKPDLVVNFGWQRMGATSWEVPHVCWIQDEMEALSKPEVIQALTPLDFNFAVDPGIAAKYKNLGYKQVDVLPFAVNEELFKPLGQEKKQSSFICHVPQVPVIHPAYFPLIRTAYLETGKSMARFAHIEPLLDAMAKQYELDINEETRVAALRVGTQYGRWLERIEAAHKLKDIFDDFVVYGMGWDLFPHLWRSYRGSLQNGDALARVYDSSRYIFHVNGINMHQRVLESIACGTEPLCKSHVMENDYSGGFEAQLPEALPLLYKSEDELKDRHPYPRVLTDAREAVLARHTFMNRAQTILDTVFGKGSA